MQIRVQLIKEMREAMLNREKDRLSTIRMLLDRVQKKEKELLRDLSEEEAIAVLQTFKKQVDEEMDAFKLVGNEDKVVELLNSKKLVESFLPKQMSEDEIKLIVGLTITKLSDNGKEINKGNLMKELIPIVKGKADNKLVNEIVTQFLK